MSSTVSTQRRLRTARMRPSRAGFSLLELMIVVVIVGISATMVGPGLMRSMAINRTNRFQYDVTRVLRRARADAIGTGRAHVLVMATVAGGNTLQLYRGDSSSCARSDWANIIGVDAAVDSVDSNTYSDHGGGGHRVRIGRGAGTPEQICFEPDGDRFGRNGPGAFPQDPGVDYIYTINRDEPDAAGVDPERYVIIGEFAAPRVVR